MELPSPAVTVSPAPYDQGDRELPQRPEGWTGAVEGMWEKNLWIRQPTQDQVPRYGDSLYDYYKEFFLRALYEFRDALEVDQ